MASLADLHDVWVRNALDSMVEGAFVLCCVVSGTRSRAGVEVSKVPDSAATKKNQTIKQPGTAAKKVCFEKESSVVHHLAQELHLNDCLCKVAKK